MAVAVRTGARKELPAIVEDAHRESVYLEKHGRVVAVVVDPARYEELVAAHEDLADIAAFDEAMAEEGPNIPWDQVKADLGLA